MDDGDRPVHLKTVKDKFYVIYILSELKKNNPQWYSHSITIYTKQQNKLIKTDDNNLPSCSRKGKHFSWPFLIVDSCS